MAISPETESALGGTKPSIRLVNYNSDFEDLWCRALDTDEPPFGDLTDLVVLWEGPSQSEPSDAMLLPHLTPLDWALLYSIRVCDGSVRGGVSIHIVDLTGAQFREAYAIRQRHQWLVEMPWIGLYGALTPAEMARMHHRRSYRPLYSSTDTARSLLRAARDSGAGYEFNASHDLARLPRTRDVGLRARLTDLLVAWAASLPNSRDHHDLNNIVGPAILTGSVDGDTNFAMAKKVTALPWWEVGAKEFRTTGLFPWNQSAQWFNRKLSVLVIDDEVDKGWGEFVQQVFGDPGAVPASISLLDNADDLVSFLETSADFKRRDYCASLSARDEMGKVPAEIIFLDLRLTQDDDALRRQSLRLLKITDRFKDIDSPAWRYIDGDALDQVRLWCGKEFSGDPNLAKDKARLLLPMLLALALPLTPIILFSSTGQTWIKGRLKPYQNILTGFEKPRILAGYDAIASALDALSDALTYTAIPMLRLRLQLAHAQAAVWVAENARRSVAMIAGNHIEIYADETEPRGDSIFSGLVVAGFDNAAAADRLQAVFEAEFDKDTDRKVWAGKKEPGGRLFAGAFGKGTDIKVDERVSCRQAGDLKSIVDLARCRTDSSWSVVATGASSVRQQLGKTPSLRQFPDRSLDAAIHFNLEFALFALLPYLATNNSKKTVAIHLPTRRCFVVNAPTEDQLHFNDVVERSRRLCRAFQVRGSMHFNRTYGDWDWGVLTYDATSGPDRGMEVNNVFPLVRGWLAGWSQLFAAKPTIDVVAIRATKLNDAVSFGITVDDAKRRRLIHDLADWACSAATSGGDNLRKALSDSQVIQNWILPDNAIEFSHTSLQLMAALRVASSDRAPDFESRDALRFVLRARRVSACDDSLLTDDSAFGQRVLLWALRDTLASATGKTLLSLLALADAV